MGKLQHGFKVNKYRVSAKEDRTRDGIVFHSKKEADYYSDLKLLKRAGEVLFFARQATFDLPGNTKYICDFVVVYADGTMEFVDVKGFKTPEYITKKKQVEAIHAPVTITEV